MQALLGAFFLRTLVVLASVIIHAYNVVLMKLSAGAMCLRFAYAYPSYR